MYIIAVNKSQELLLNVRRLFIYFFSTTTQGIRLRRRVDVFSTTLIVHYLVSCLKTREECYIVNQSAADCLLSLKFGIGFNHMTPDVLQTFKVKWSTQKSRSWRKYVVYARNCCSV